MSDRKASLKRKNVVVPLAMSGELERKIELAAERVKLSKQDTMRLSIERGLEVLVAQLTHAPPPAHAA